MYIGQVFHKWTVVASAGSNHGGHHLLHSISDLRTQVFEMLDRKKRKREPEEKV